MSIYPVTPKPVFCGNMKPVFSAPDSGAPLPSLPSPNFSGLWPRWPWTCDFPLFSYLVFSSLRCEHILDAVIYWLKCDECESKCESPQNSSESARRTPSQPSTFYLPAFWPQAFVGPFGQLLWVGWLILTAPPTDAHRMLCCVSHLQVACTPGAVLLPVKAAEAGDQVIVEEEGVEDGEGEEAKLDKADLSQVQRHTKTKVDRGGNWVFGESWIESNSWSRSGCLGNKWGDPVIFVLFRWATLSWAGRRLRQEIVSWII